MKTDKFETSLPGGFVKIAFGSVGIVSFPGAGMRHDKWSVFAGWMCCLVWGGRLIFQQ